MSVASVVPSRIGIITFLSHFISGRAPIGSVRILSDNRVIPIRPIGELVRRTSDPHKRIRQFLHTCSIRLELQNSRCRVTFFGAHETSHKLPGSQEELSHTVGHIESQVLDCYVRIGEPLQHSFSAEDMSLCGRVFWKKIPSVSSRKERLTVRISLFRRAGRTCRVH